MRSAAQAAAASSSASGRGVPAANASWSKIRRGSTGSSTCGRPAAASSSTKRRGADERVRLEQKARGDQPPRRQRHQIGERGPLALQAFQLARPAQLPEHRGRVEDVAPRRLRPLAFDEPRQLHQVELAEARAGAVHHVHAAVAGARREGLRVDPAPHQRPQCRESSPARRRIARRHRAASVSVVSTAARARRWRARSGLAERRVIGQRRRIVRRQEREQRVQVRRHAAAPPAAAPARPRRSAAPGRPAPPASSGRAARRPAPTAPPAAPGRRDRRDTTARRARGPGRPRRAAVTSRPRCGERSSAAAGPRAKLDPTAASTTSSAAAKGSAASGSASNIWHGTPAARKISRAT